jgi:PAS domain S-box-containing protein
LSRETQDSPKILIVEDDHIIAKGLSHRLKNLGYEVCAIASTGEEAIEKAAERSPDLVLMDIRLEGNMEGTEAAISIRSSLNLPIVFVTAHADKAVLELAKKAEPFGYLVKPYNEKDLRSTLEMALYKVRTEKALVYAKEEWERTFDAVSDLIMVLDRDYTIRQANRAAGDRLGMTREELVGQKCFELVHKRDHPLPVCPLSKMLLDDEAHNAEVTDERLGRVFEEHVSPLPNPDGGRPWAVLFARDITERKRAEEERERLLLELQQALAEVKKLSGFLPICASCKKIRDDQGYWQQIEAYIRDHSEAQFSHGICPECAEKLYPGFYRKDEK